MMTVSKDLPPLTSPWFPNLFFKTQFRTTPKYPPKGTDLTGKVAIITGSNSGIGYEAARQFLSFNLSRLIMALRAKEKGEAAAGKLRSQYPKAGVEVWILDMACYESVRAFAGRVNSDLPRLDIAVLNAGVGRLRFGKSASTGHEEMIQTNYLSTVLLTILLLPILNSKSPAGTPGRLSITSTGLAYNCKLPNRDESPLLPSFDDEQKFSREQYASSKLLAHMFIYNLVDYVSADDVVVNLVDPGYVKGTELSRDIPLALVPLLMLFQTATGRSVKLGASTYVHATIMEGKESHGCSLMSWEIWP